MGRVTPSFSPKHSIIRRSNLCLGPSPIPLSRDQPRARKRRRDAPGLGPGPGPGAYARFRRTKCSTCLTWAVHKSGKAGGCEGAVRKEGTLSTVVVQC